MLDAHQGGLAQLAGLRPDRGQDDDRPSSQVGRLGAVRRLVSLGLAARPVGRARCVVAFSGMGGIVARMPIGRPGGVAIGGSGPSGLTAGGEAAESIATGR